MSSTLKKILPIVSPMPSRMGVRESPAARNAPPSMKNIIMPNPNTNMMRRNGKASACTASDALTSPSKVGAKT